MMGDLIEREAALKAIDPGYGDFHSGNYNAIRALPAVTVAVKPLEWEGGRAKTPFGDYFVYQDSPGMWCVNFEASHMVLDGIRVQPTEASAKSAAQSDYASRIRAALDVAPVSLADAAKVPEIAALIEAIQSERKIEKDISTAERHGRDLGQDRYDARDIAWVAVGAALRAIIAEGTK